MRRLFVILLAAVSYLSGALAANSVENFTLSQSYWVDQAGTANLEEARRAKFRTYEGSLAEGYSSAALWLKVRIAGRTDGEPLALVIKPAFLRHLELYDPDVQGFKADPVISGRDAPINYGTYIGLDNGFVLSPTIKSRDVYLRIKTTTSLTVQISVLPYEMANQQSYVTGGMLAVYFAFILGFCLWGIVNWGVRKDSLYGLFAFRQFYSLLHIFVFFGSLRFFFGNILTADTREIIYAFVTCTVMMATGFFDVRLISEFGGARWLRRVILGLLCLPLLSLLLIWADRTQLALQLMSGLINVVMLALVIFTLTANGGREQPYGRASLWFLRLGFLTMAAVVVVPMMMYHNVLRSNVPIFGIVFVHAVISTVILFAILSIRGHQRDLVAQETRLRMQVQEAELHRESRRRVEKERFLSMLTHELRNPLSVIRLLTGSAGTSAAIVNKAAQDMAEVIERVEQSEKIDGGHIQVDRRTFDAAALLVEIASEHAEAARLQIDAPAPRPITNDSGLFRRIVGNLLDNAAKYSAEGTPIRITLADQAIDGTAGIRLTVVNEIGASGAPDPDRLFTKYYRSKRAHRFPGSGLGLFLVASWAKAMGGSVSYAESAPREASFSLWLPL